MIKLLGFAPDLDPTTPGVIRECSNLVPTINGMAGAPTPESATIGGSTFSALSGDCIGAAILTRLDGLTRIIAGTDTYLYELCPASSGSGLYPSGSAGWRVVSSAYPAFGAGISVSDDYPRWRFAQMGNVTLATAPGVNIIQTSEDFGGTFSNLDVDFNAPEARILETAAGFVMAFYTSQGYGGTEERPDGWWCSALYNPYDWIPSAATQSANGRLLDTPGEIRGAKRLGDGIVAYKAKSMYVGAYVGPPIIWAWSLVSGEIGAVSHEAIASTGYAHYFMGENDFWMFDGTRPVSIGDLIRTWWQADRNPSLLHKAQAHYDQDKKLIRWWYASGTDTEITSCLVYHVPTGKWGKETAISAPLAALDYVEPFDTYDPTNDYTHSPAIIDSDGNLQTLTGANIASGVTFGYYGDDDAVSLLRRVRLRFGATQATTGAVTISSAQNLGDSLTSRGTSSIANSKSDMLYSDRWFRPACSLTGDFELLGIDLDMVPAGRR